MNTDNKHQGFVDQHEINHPCNREFPEVDFRYVTADRARELERIVRCAMRAFDKHLNTVETRIIKRIVARLGIRVHPCPSVVKTS